MTWAQRRKRIFNIDIQTCPDGQGSVKIIAAIEDPDVIHKIRTHLKEKAPAPNPRGCPRAGPPPPRTGFANPESFFEKFKDIGNANEADQLILANSARLLGLRNTLPIDQIWKKLTDQEWRNETFRKLRPVALEILFIAFSSSLHRGGDKWLASLPHLYAHACEDIRGDADRTELLFIFTVISCIHSYSVSAPGRLLSGDRRPELLELGRQWRRQLLDSSRAASPWVVARIRALTAAISASL